MIGITRRQWLAGATTAPLAACVAHRSATRRARPLGLADLTVMAPLSADYAGTLRHVARAGYTHFGFRLAGYSAQDKSELSPPVKAQLVRAAGLEIGVVRYGMGGNFPAQAEAAAAIGARIIAISAAPVFFRGRRLGEATRTQFESWLPELGNMAKTASSLGLRLAYHNHWWDHMPLEGRTPLDLIAERYSPAEVGFEIDLAWAWLGGVDPLWLIQSLGPRVLAMHFKDVDPARGNDRMAQLARPGEGRLDYPSLIPRIDKVTSAIGYVEVDKPKDGLEDAIQAAIVIQRARTKAGA